MTTQPGGGPLMDDDITTEIEATVADLIRRMPDFEYPEASRHSIVLAMMIRLEGPMMDHFDGMIPYWRALADAARI